MRRPQRIEDLDELFAGRLVVPAAVAADHLEQLIYRRFAAAASVQRQSKIEFRLQIRRIGGDLPLQIGKVSGRPLCLLGDIDGSERRPDLGAGGDVLRQSRGHLTGAGDIALSDAGADHACDRFRLPRILLQHPGEAVGGGADITGVQRRLCLCEQIIERHSTPCSSKSTNWRSLLSGWAPANASTGRPP